MKKHIKEPVNRFNICIYN